jgi:predicted RecA/RadA family phage recombinase
MAANKVQERTARLNMKVPSTVKSGDLLVFGSTSGGKDPNVLLVGIAVEDATDAFSNALDTIAVDREGVFTLNVQGEFGSPLVLHAFNPGDAVYADIDGAGGTYDATTNVWTGFKLNGNSGGVLVGYVLDAVSAGTGTTAVRVALKAS